MTDELRGKPEAITIVDEGAFAKDQPVRIRCSICAHEEEGRCAEKKVKVSINKSRRCAQFIMAPEKIKVKKKAKGTYIPFHMRDKNAYKQNLKKRAEQVKEQSLQQKLDVLKSPDVLSRFRSSAGDK